MHFRCPGIYSPLKMLILCPISTELRRSRFSLSETLSVVPSIDPTLIQIESGVVPMPCFIETKINLESAFVTKSLSGKCFKP